MTHAVLNITLMGARRPFPAASLILFLCSPAPQLPASDVKTCALQMCKLLFELGANVFARNSKNRTPRYGPSVAMSSIVIPSATACTASSRSIAFTSYHLGLSLLGK